MFYVYVVKCKDNSLYTGYTNDIEKRLEKHNHGTGAKYTRGRRPVKLFFCQSYKTKSDALKAEAKIKKLDKKEKIKMIGL